MPSFLLGVQKSHLRFNLKPEATWSKSTIFNETQIEHYTGQFDVPITATEEQEMHNRVADHDKQLQLNESQEMMVGIACMQCHFEYRRLNCSISLYAYWCYSGFEQGELSSSHHLLQRLLWENVQFSSVCKTILPL
jgi:hypothetical protein